MRSNHIVILPRKSGMEAKSSSSVVPNDQVVPPGGIAVEKKGKLNSKQKQKDHHKKKKKHKHRKRKRNSARSIDSKSTLREEHRRDIRGIPMLVTTSTVAATIARQRSQTRHVKAGHYWDPVEAAALYAVDNMFQPLGPSPLIDASSIPKSSAQEEKAGKLVDGNDSLSFSVSSSSSSSSSSSYSAYSCYSQTCF